MLKSAFPIGLLALLLSLGTNAGEMLQPGFYYHEPSAITLSNVGSGVICAGESGDYSLCEKAIKIFIKGDDTCDWPEGQQNPCTHFGYEFDYSNAQPGTRFECERTRYNPSTGEQKDRYQRNIEQESGRLSFLTFRTYAPVEERIIFSEVHDCTYLGEPVASIEYIIYYEPGVGPGTGPDARQYFAEVPDACAEPYLTRDTAKSLLRVRGVDDHVATEHYPQQQSQCIYTAAGAPVGHVGYVFKFMLSDLFDVEKLSLIQLDFNAKFANGGTDAVDVMTQPGERAWFYRKGDRETLFMITGIKGSNDPVGRSREFVAHYYIDDPNIEPSVKQASLLEQARLHMQYWQQLQ